MATIAIGADHAGFALKQQLKGWLTARGHEVIDHGTHSTDSVDYPDFAALVARSVQEGDAARGVLVCGSGIGMAIAANKVAGVRAATAHDSFSVERSVLSNNCQVLTMGQRVVGLELARRLAREWVGYTFDPESASAGKLNVLSDYEGC